jgi:hypothetical protein
MYSQSVGNDSSVQQNAWIDFFQSAFSEVSTVAYNATFAIGKYFVPSALNTSVGYAFGDTLSNRCHVPGPLVAKLSVGAGLIEACALWVFVPDLSALAGGAVILSFVAGATYSVLPTAEQLEVFINDFQQVFGIGRENQAVHQHDD